MSDRFLGGLGRLYLGLILVFLYAPILVMAAMSFNASEFYQLPFAFSTEWYERLWRNDEILTAAWRSVWIAVVVTVIATSLGTAASIALFRYEFPGRKVLQLLLFPPIAIPWNSCGAIGRSTRKPGSAPGRANRRAWWFLGALQPCRGDRGRRQYRRYPGGAPEPTRLAAPDAGPASESD